MEPTFILVGLVVGRSWIVPVAAVCAALLVTSTTSLTLDGFVAALILGALNAAAGAAVRVFLRRGAGLLGRRRSTLA